MQESSIDIRFPDLKTEEKNVERMCCGRGCMNGKKGCECSGSLKHRYSLSRLGNDLERMAEYFFAEVPYFTCVRV